LKLGNGVLDQKIERYGWPRKKFDDIFSRLDTILERDGRTDGQTDRQTDTGRQQRPRLYA